ncbi:hypothetical protein [Mycobacterium gastri]|nr:hypothetical protein [Mycobacterium gastri]
MRSVLVWLMVFCGSILTATPARGDESTCRPAELFVADDESPLFELQADVTIALAGAVVTGSTPADGVFWSNEPQQVTYESAREFHLCVVDEPTLHTVAEALRRQLNQEAVLTFAHLPEANAVMITVPNIDVAHFREAFVADSAAHHRLLGGSVTTDHTLILIADNDDLDLARRLVEAAGGRWSAATIAYGRREFVNSA